MTQTQNLPYVINLGNSIIGVSVLAMPFCFKQCGIILGVLLLLFSTWLTLVSCQLLVKAGVTSRRRSYEFLAYHLFGPAGKFIVEVGMIGLQIGTLIAQIVIVGDLGPAIVSKVFGLENTSSLRTWLIIGLCLFVGLPLGLLKDLRTVSHASTICMCFYAVFVVYVLGLSGPNLWSGNWYPKVEFWNPAGVFQTLPIFALSFGCQTQLFLVYDALPEPSLKTINSIISSAVNFCAVAYLLVGFFGYIAFYGDDITGDIISQFPSTFTADVMKLCFVFSIVITFPVIIFPCRSSLFTLLFPQKPKTHEDFELDNRIPELPFKIITLAIICGSMIVGILVPNVEFILGMNGATVGTLICYIFPALFFMRVMTAKTEGRFIAQLVMFFGVSILLLSTFTTLYTQDKGHTHPVVQKAYEGENILKEDMFNLPKMKNPETRDEKRIEPPIPKPPDDTLGKEKTAKPENIEKTKESDQKHAEHIDSEKTKDKDRDKEKMDIQKEKEKSVMKEDADKDEKPEKKPKKSDVKHDKESNNEKLLADLVQQQKEVIKQQKELLKELKDHKEKEHVALGKEGQQPGLINNAHPDVIHGQVGENPLNQGQLAQQVLGQGHEQIFIQGQGQVHGQIQQGQQPLIPQGQQQQVVPQGQQQHVVPQGQQQQVVPHGQQQQVVPQGQQQQVVPQGQQQQVVPQGQQQQLVPQGQQQQVVPQGQQQQVVPQDQQQQVVPQGQQQQVFQHGQQGQQQQVILQGQRQQIVPQGQQQQIVLKGQQQQVAQQGQQQAVAQGQPLHHGQKQQQQPIPLRNLQEAFPQGQAQQLQGQQPAVVLQHQGQGQQSHGLKEAIPHGQVKQQAIPKQQQPVEQVGHLEKLIQEQGKVQAVNDQNAAGGNNKQQAAQEPVAVHFKKPLEDPQLAADSLLNREKRDVDDVLKTLDLNSDVKFVQNSENKILSRKKRSTDHNKEQNMEDRVQPKEISMKPNKVLNDQNTGKPAEIQNVKESGDDKKIKSEIKRKVKGSDTVNMLSNEKLNYELGLEKKLIDNVKHRLTVFQMSKRR